MLNNNIKTLWDISSWKDNAWIGWKKPQMLDALDQVWSFLLTKLKGMSPINIRKQDKRGWGSQTGSYTVAQGYAQLKKIPHVPCYPVTWRGLWRQKYVPKIDFFSWLLCHNSILA